MNSHIAIVAADPLDGKFKPLTLADDFSLDIDDQNPLFNESEMFSYPVQIPMEGNRFLLGNIDDPLSEGRPVQLEHTKMRILVDNAPFRSGTLVTSEDEEIAGSLSMNISAAEHSLTDLIGTMTCREVPLKHRILIGEKIGDVTAQAKYKYHVRITYSGKKPDHDEWPEAQDTAMAVFTPQALGFSCPGECYVKSGSKDEAVQKEVVDYADGNKVVKPKIKTSYINVSEPYPAAKYCNARIAYYHHGIDDEGNTTEALDPEWKKTGPEKHFPYWVLDADRQQSGVCFYVMYFLECLFAHLGVSYDQSELMKVDDMRRLCFFTTHCKFDEVNKYPNDEKKPYFDNLDDINKWLDSRGCGGRFDFHEGDGLQVNDVDYTANDGQHYAAEVGKDGITSIEVKIHEVVSRTFTGNIMQMYANSDNFPDESVSVVLDSLFASFGIQFDYNYEKRHVRAYFLRSVFRNDSEPIDFPGTVISMNKVSEKIGGVRVCYSAEGGHKEQKANVQYKKTDYNTAFDYIDYPEDRTVINKTYAEIFRAPQAEGAKGDMTCYIDQQTGNAYRIKVRKDAESAQGLKPALFEVGQWKGVELGDCSDLNADFVTEIKSDFIPVEFNDVNYQAQVKTATGTYHSNGQTAVLNRKSQAQQVLAAYVDESMEHEFIEHSIRQVLASNLVESYVVQRIKLIENYDPTTTEDGNSPLQSMDWGLAIALNRGGGTDATIQSYDFNYDGFGSAKWRMVAGQYALTSDSIDHFGRVYDYNGVMPGVGNGERFSLKIRAWKQPKWAKQPLIRADEVDPATGDVITKYKTRGLYDSFLSEYANFLLKRRKYRISILANAAQIADVPNHWGRRFRINGMVGYINKLSYSVSLQEGVKDLVVEFFVV